MPAKWVECEYMLASMRSDCRIVPDWVAKGGNGEGGCSQLKGKALRLWPQLLGGGLLMRGLCCFLYNPQY